jgi:hypothetical protein
MFGRPAAADVVFAIVHYFCPFGYCVTYDWLIERLDKLDTSKNRIKVELK